MQPFAQQVAELIARSSINDGFFSAIYPATHRATGFATNCMVGYQRDATDRATGLATDCRSVINVATSIAISSATYLTTSCATGCRIVYQRSATGLATDRKTGCRAEPRSPLQRVARRIAGSLFNVAILVVFSLCNPSPNWLFSSKFHCNQLNDMSFNLIYSNAILQYSQIKKL